MEVVLLIICLVFSFGILHFCMSLMLQFRTNSHLFQCPYLENLLDRRHLCMHCHLSHPITCFILLFFCSFSILKIVQAFSVIFLSKVPFLLIYMSLISFHLISTINSSFTSLWLTFIFEDPIISVYNEFTFRVFVSNFIRSFVKIHSKFITTLSVIIYLPLMRINLMLCVSYFLICLDKIKDFSFITLIDANLLQIHNQLLFMMHSFYLVFLKS